MPAGRVAVAIWRDLRGEAGGGFGPAPVRRQDVSEELEAAEIHDPALRQRMRSWVRAIDEGFERGKRKPDEHEEKKEKDAEGMGVLLHYRRQFRAQKNP